MKKKKALPTIWEIPDELWKRMAPLILEMDPPKDTGRPRANPRNVMDAIIFRIRTGCQWNHIPRVYGDDSTIHRTFQHSVEIGLFSRLWALLVEECEEFGLVDRPKPTQKKPQHLCLDKGYDNPTGKAAVEKHHYTGHIRRIGEEKLSQGKKSIQLAGGSWKEH